MVTLNSKGLWTGCKNFGDLVGFYIGELIIFIEDISAYYGFISIGIFMIVCSIFSILLL